MSSVKVLHQQQSAVKVPSFASIGDVSRDRMMNAGKYRKVLLELAVMLHRLEELIVKTTPLTKEERLEQERISNIDLDMKMKELIPVYHGFLDAKVEGNKARQSVFKLARYVYKMEKEASSLSLSSSSSASSSRSTGGGFSKS